MHTSSKVLLGLVVLLAIAAFFLTSMLYDARNEWLKRVDERQVQVEDLTEQLRRQRLVVGNLTSEVNRRMTPWGRTWEVPSDRIRLDANAAAMELPVGLNAGLGLREQAQGKPLPTVYLFGQNEDRSSMYLGAFRVTALEPDRARAELVRRPYPGEVAQWQATVGVRVWESIPSHWRMLQADLQAQTAVALQAVQNQQARLATQQLLTTKSEEQLERRTMELSGDPDPVEGAGQDRRDGLILALRKEESARNQQLAVLDQLRHEYDAKYNALIDLIARNRNMVAQLPQPPAGSENPPVLQVSQSGTQR